MAWLWNSSFAAHSSFSYHLSLNWTQKISPRTLNTHEKKSYIIIALHQLLGRDGLLCARTTQEIISFNEIRKRNFLTKY